MAVQPAQRLLTVEEYYKMTEAGILAPEDRVELIEGKIIEMSPIGSKHAACVDKIIAKLNRLNHPDVLIRGQHPARLGKFSEPEPDIAIVRPATDHYASGHPSAEDVLAIIEVADSYLEYDREVKLPLYAAAKIPVCWIVNLEKREIEAYHTPFEGRYKNKEIFLISNDIELNSLNISLAVESLLI